MYLSKLVFLSVKNVIYLNDSSFNYEGFCAGDFDNDVDYVTNINNVFSPLNEAIARLQDLDRIPYEVKELEVQADKTAELPTDCRKVIGVAQVGNDGSIRKLVSVPFGKNKVRITSPFSTFNSKIYVEYKENIPTFSKLDVLKAYEEQEDIELFERYGIDEGMSNYIIEYVQGKLLEPIAPELANMHVTRAEAYFNNLPTARKNFPQRAVETKFVIGE